MTGFPLPLVSALDEWEERACVNQFKAVETQQQICVLSSACAQVHPIPNNLEVHMRWGRPIEIVEQQAEPEQWQVERLFGLYIRELVRLFDEHKDQCLPAAVAQRGLTVVWRGHTVQELETLIAAVGPELSDSLHLTKHEALVESAAPQMQSRL